MPLPPTAPPKFNSHNEFEMYDVVETDDRTFEMYAMRGESGRLADGQERAQSGETGNSSPVADEKETAELDQILGPWVGGHPKYSEYVKETNASKEPAHSSNTQQTQNDRKQSDSRSSTSPAPDLNRLKAGIKHPFPLNPKYINQTNASEEPAHSSSTPKTENDRKQSDSGSSASPAPDLNRLKAGIAHPFPLKSTRGGQAQSPNRRSAKRRGITGINDLPSGGQSYLEEMVAGLVQEAPPPSNPEMNLNKPTSQDFEAQ
jgi:hypothetical protein